MMSSNAKWGNVILGNVFLMIIFCMLFSFVGCKTTSSSQDIPPYEFQMTFPAPEIFLGEMDEGDLDLFESAKERVAFDTRGKNEIQGNFCFSILHQGVCYYDVYGTLFLHVENGECDISFRDISYSCMGDMFNSNYIGEKGEETLLEGDNMVGEIQEKLNLFVKNFRERMIKIPSLLG